LKIDRWKTAFEIGHRAPENENAPTRKSEIDLGVGNGRFSKKYLRRALLLMLIYIGKAALDPESIFLASPKLHVRHKLVSSC
jgi:hypothetical protein